MSDDDIAALITLQEGFENRPKNTNLAYDKKAAEFSKWCIDVVGYPDGATVSGSKLHRFLRDQVCNRTNRKDKHKQIGFFTVRNYKSAIVDLYMQQKGMKMNRNEHPSSFPALKSLMDQYKRGQDSRSKANYTDRGHGTLLEGFTSVEDLIKMSNYFLELNKPVAIRNRLMFLLPHFTLCRGENVRQLQLPDLFYLKLDREGYSVCHALVAVMSQGKRNQYGRKEVGSFVRNKDVALCPLGALALYFFVVFQIWNKPFPNLQRNSDWYDLYLMPGEVANKPLSFSTHYKAIKDMLDSLGIKSTVKTHMGRGSGSRMADVLGASEPDIRRSGRWNQQAVSCYLTSLPRETMRTLAGFPKDRGHFYISRAAVVPPESLQQQIFPDVTHWLAVHGISGEADIEDQSVQHSIATDGFLMLMVLLRTVFLQDSVFLRDLYPSLFIWKHPIFETTEYQSFYTELKDSVSTSSVPEEERLQQAVPLIAEKLASLTEILQDHHNHIASKLNSQLESHFSLERKLADIFSGRSSIRVVADRFSLEQETTETATEADGAPTASDSNIPKYTLCRSLSTVHEVWKEYTEGFGNNASVKELEQKYGAMWRREPKEQRYFSRRNILYKKIEELIRSGITEEDAVNELEALRATKELSLDAFQKFINKNP